MGAVLACGLCHWGPQRSSLWGHAPCEGCSKWVRSPPAACATAAFGGAPCGATNRVRGVPKWVAVPACG
eukprot:368186-Pyramimonas_sp.AAC.1